MTITTQAPETELGEIQLAEDPLSAEPTPSTGPTSLTGQSQPAPQHDFPQPSGLPNLLSTGDSDLVAKLWIFFGLAFGVFTFVIGMLQSAERLGSAGIDIFAGELANFQFFTLHRISLVLLCVVPLFIGLAMAVVPKQVGARSVAFPRLATASFYTWLVAAGIMLASWGINGGLTAGGEQQATELSLLSLGLLAIALTGASVVIVCTVILQRSEQFPWITHVPFFALAMLIAGGLWIVSFPVLLADVVVMWVDARGATAARYGLGENLYAQISWITDQQQVFGWSLPVLGIAGDAIVSSVRPDAGPLGAVPQQSQSNVAHSKTVRHAKFVMGLFAIFAWGGALNSFYTPGYTRNPVFVIAAFGVVLVILALGRPFAKLITGSIRNTGQGATRNKLPRISVPLILASFGFLMLLGAGIVACIRNFGNFAGALRIFSDDAGWQQNLDDLLNPFNNLAGTTAASAVLYAALLASLLSVMAGLWLWSPQIFGRKLSTPAGIMSGLLIAGGTLMFVVSELVSGFWGQADRPPMSLLESQLRGRYLGSDIEAANAVSFVGTLLILAGVLTLALSYLAMLKSASSAKSAVATGESA